MEALKLTSPAFQEGQAIPVRHTCDGPDLSPALEWSKGPSGVKSFALICEDPDAPRGLWVHWVIWGLPPNSTTLPEAVATSKVLPSQARQGKNDFSKIGYGGPCPPPGKPHRYFFRIYALDVVPGLEAGASRADLLRAMEGHIVAEGHLMGKYGR
jgi:Raf kinase inhibitor-like YbhB/YbcL family protein